MGGLTLSAAKHHRNLLNNLASSLKSMPTPCACRVLRDGEGCTHPQRHCPYRAMKQVNRWGRRCLLASLRTRIPIISNHSIVLPNCCRCGAPRGSCCFQEGDERLQGGNGCVEGPLHRLVAGLHPQHARCFLGGEDRFHWHGQARAKARLLWHVAPRTCIRGTKGAGYQSSSQRKGLKGTSLGEKHTLHT